MSPKLCDDSNIIKAVRKYIDGIQSAKNKNFAYDFWCAMYNESAYGANAETKYPNSDDYNITWKTANRIRVKIQSICEENKTIWN